MTSIQNVNPRIQELATEAGISIEYLTNTKQLATLVAFAELIVQECVLTVQMGISRDGNTTEKYLRSMKHLKDIKEHFGINHDN